MDKELFTEVFKKDLRKTFVPVCALLLVVASVFSIPIVMNFGQGLTIAIAVYVGAILFAFFWTAVGTMGSYRKKKMLQK